MKVREKMTRAAYVGRFQPFHYGHLSALKWILERENEVVLIVGSAQYSHSFNNPFTLGERIDMIWNTLKYEKLLEQVIIVGVPDTNGQHSLWVQLVKAYAPEFSKVYSNDPLTKLLFKEYGYEVHPIPFFERKKYNATRIRRLIINSEPWEQLVPPPVAQVIKRIRGDKRLRELYTGPV